MNWTKRALKHTSSVSVASSGIKICFSTCRDSDVTVRSFGDTSPLRGGLGSHWLSTVGASRSFEVSPPHIVTNPSGVIILHTPPSPSFHVLRQMSEDPGLGTTTGKDRDCVDSASHGFSPHHFTLIPPVFSSVPFLSLFFLRLWALSAHFVTTGLLPGSRPDIRHMSRCFPGPHCLKPDRVWGLNWGTTVTRS